MEMVISQQTVCLGRIFFFSSSDTKIDSITARCPLRFPPKHATLRWTWIDGNGPFITNSVLRENPFSSFDTESDLVTATMFNLENLNANNLEAYQGVAQRRGQIPEVPGSYIESLVRRVNRSKLRFEIGVPSTGPSIRRSQDLAHEVKHARGSSTFLEVGQTHNVTHFVSNPSQEEVQHQAVNLETGLRKINISKLYALRPGPPSPTSTQSDLCPISYLHYNEWLESTSGAYGASRKIFRVEFGKPRRNIRQRLHRGYFSKEGIRKLSSINHASTDSQEGHLQNTSQQLETGT